MLVPRALLVLLLVLVAASALWLWQRSASAPPPPPSPTATSTAVVPTPTPLRAPPGYRLAGVAVGEPESFAVIEVPNGRNALYRVGADIPGLGRLVSIDAEHVVVEAAGGQFELWVAAAATATPTPPGTADARAATAPPRVRPPAVGKAPAPRP